MNNKILEIVSKNKADLVEKKQQMSLDILKKQIKTVPNVRDFYTGVIDGYKQKGIGLITEIKLASPTEKELGSANQIVDRVKVYEQAGTDAISVVTEKYFFHGDASLVKTIKDTAMLPVLQKDFIVDPYQIYEARVSGADALLLIVKLLDQKTLKEFVALCVSLGMEPVVEIHDEHDFAKAIQTNTRIIAVNARDLDTFTVNVAKACNLLKKIPTTFLPLGFSGIHSAKEVGMYTSAGAKGVLVGTSLMKADNIEEHIKTLRNL